MASSPALPSQGNEATPKPVSMRGRKKHKCSVCGNSAKSRCPFHSCKGCCVKAKNPCHIHVLKSTPAGEAVQGLSEKLTHPAASGTNIRQHHPGDSLRLRTLKPPGIITRKEAALINQLRFQKLKEYREGTIEAEDLAFDRYLQNMRLLEVIFGGDTQDFQGLSSKGHLMIEGISDSKAFSSAGVDASDLSAGLQARVQSSSKRKEAQRQKLRRVMDRGLQRLLKGDHADSMLDNEDVYSVYSDVRRDMKRIKVQSVEGKDRLRKMDVFASITEKVRQAESQEDFNSCLKTLEDNFVSRDTSCMNTSEVLQQVPHSQEPTKVVGEDGSIRLPLLNFRKDDVKHGVFNDRMVDPCGVLKSWWKVDLIPGGLDFYIDVPTTRLQEL